MSRPPSAPLLSLVIPVLDEAPLLPELFSRLAEFKGLAEVIVVDGGSTDGSDLLCAERADVFLRSAPGRAVQQNAGAAVARGEYLLFLHCDTVLTITASEFENSLQRGPAWGFFPVRLSGSDWRFRVIERFMSWRSALTHVATGDQALFVSRAMFQRLGGFAQMPLMEDVELSKRLRRQASPSLLAPPVVTSSRRWERQGVIRTVLLMWFLRLGYWLGANPATLARRYRGGDRMSAVVIAQLARAPVPGQVKSRLLPALTARRAADLHAAMVRRIAGQLADAAPLELWVAGDMADPLFQQCLQLGVRRLREQPAGDLGERMLHIARAGLSEYGRVILVGSDAPGLDSGYVERAMSALDEVDAVFGPALDGGYVLLGLRCVCPELFRDIPWGSDKVLAASLSAADAAGRSHRLLDPLPDIDRPEDLRHLPEDLDW